MGSAFYLEANSKMPNSPISTSGLNRNPQNITIYSSGYDPTPSLTSNHFSFFEIASIPLGFVDGGASEISTELAEIS